MTVYETISHCTIRLWCEAMHYWPACPAGESDRVRIGGNPFAEPEELEYLDWEDWFKVFEARQFKFVYNPSDGWCDIQPRHVKPD